MLPHATQLQTSPNSSFRDLHEVDLPVDDGQLPIDARAALLKLELTPPPQAVVDRRSTPRRTMRAESELKTGGGSETAGQWPRLIVKDATRQSVGFICDRPIAVGCRGHLSLPLAGGGQIEAAGYVGRCRQIMEDWYEGVFHFESPLSLQK